MDGLTTGMRKDGCGWVIVMACTNRPNALDPAVLRRLPFKVEVPLPSREGRAEILHKMLTGVSSSSSGSTGPGGLRSDGGASTATSTTATSTTATTTSGCNAGGVDVEAIAAATESYSGSDLRAVVSCAQDLPRMEAIARQRAAVAAGATRHVDIRALTTEDFLQALERIPPTAPPPPDWAYEAWRARPSASRAVQHRDGQQQRQQQWQQQQQPEGGLQGGGGGGGSGATAYGPGTDKRAGSAFPPRLAVPQQCPFPMKAATSES